MPTRSKSSTVRFEALQRIALAEAPSDAQLLAKVRALKALVEAGAASPVGRDRLLKELRGVAELEPVTSRGTDAMLQALDLIDTLDSPQDADGEPARDPDPFFDLIVASLVSEALYKRPPLPDEWGRGSARTRKVMRISNGILADDDPEAAFGAWAVKQSRRAR